MAHIGRLQALGIAFETVSGTKETATDWLPKVSGLVKPVFETLKDTSGYGVIDEVYEAHPIRESSETTISGNVGIRMIGYLLLGTLGASSITGVGPYTHSFTRLNSNNHPAFTLWGYDPVGTYSACYSMVESLTLSAKIGDYVMYEASFKGKKLVSESTPSVSYSSSDHQLRARDMKIYLSNTEGSWGTALSCESFKITINKNLYLHQNLGELDVASIHNQQLTVSGDMELMYDNVTYQDYVKNGTNKYMKIEIINTDTTMSPSGNPTLTITLGKVVFETWSETDDNNQIVKQTIGFSGAFNNADAYTIKATLINEKNADYDA